MKRTRVNHTSAKKRAQEREISRLKAERFETQKWCSGCGKSTTHIGALDYSHIVKRSARPDLITHPKNFTLDCRECHRVWDRGDVIEQMKLVDFDHRIRVMKQLAPDVYHLHYDMPKLPPATEEDNLPFI